MDTFLFIILTLFMLTVLVVVHEFGHFIVAKRADIYVIEFAIGMGPMLFSHQGKETRLTIRALPIGGFCRMWGEAESSGDGLADEAVSGPNLPANRSFMHSSKGRKMLVLLAGPAMNFVLAVLTMMAVYLLEGHGAASAIKGAFASVAQFTTAIYQSFRMIFAGQAGLNDFAGPVGLVGMVGSFYRYGLRAMLSFTAFISVNLGVLNLLPLPALDGGQILIAAIEAIIRRDLDPEKAAWINGIGFAALMALAVVIAVNDVLRYLH